MFPLKILLKIFFGPPENFNFLYIWRDFFPIFGKMSEPYQPLLREVPASETETVCKLCFRPAPKDRAERRQLGALYEYAVNPVDEIYCAHFFCLLFSSGLDQNGEESEGILGFR